MAVENSSSRTASADVYFYVASPSYLRHNSRPLSTLLRRRVGSSILPGENDVPMPKTPVSASSLPICLSVFGINAFLCS